LGGYTGKITISGSASCSLPADVLPRLANAVVGRLASAESGRVASAESAPLAGAGSDRLSPAEAGRPPSGVPSPGIPS